MRRPSIRRKHRRLIALATWLIVPGCVWGGKSSEADIYVANQTDESLFITYGESSAEAAKADRHPRELEITRGAIDPISFSPVGEGNGSVCLGVPLVARSQAGVEVDRLETGTCWADDFLWAVGEPFSVTEATTP